MGGRLIAQDPRCSTTSREPASILRSSRGAELPTRTTRIPRTKLPQTEHVPRIRSPIRTENGPPVARSFDSGYAPVRRANQLGSAAANQETASRSRRPLNRVRSCCVGRNNTTRSACSKRGARRRSLFDDHHPIGPDRLRRHTASRGPRPRSPGVGILRAPTHPASNASGDPGERRRPCRQRGTRTPPRRVGVSAGRLRLHRLRAEAVSPAGFALGRTARAGGAAREGFPVPGSREIPPKLAGYQSSSGPRLARWAPSRLNSLYFPC